MDISIANCQIKAIADLIDAMEQPNKEIVLKSCTGSGKTIILTHFMDEYFKGYPKTVFVWLTPGKGDLEERQVIHLYADSRGNISHTQSLTGIQEVVRVYDYSSAESFED